MTAVPLCHLLRVQAFASIFSILRICRESQDGFSAFIAGVPGVGIGDGIPVDGGIIWFGVEALPITEKVDLTVGMVRAAIWWVEEGEDGFVDDGYVSEMLEKRERESAISFVAVKTGVGEGHGGLWRRRQANVNM